MWYVCYTQVLDHKIFLFLIALSTAAEKRYLLYNYRVIINNICNPCCNSSMHTHTLHKYWYYLSKAYKPLLVIYSITFAR